MSVLIDILQTSKINQHFSMGNTVPFLSIARYHGASYPAALINGTIVSNYRRPIDHKSTFVLIIADTILEDGLRFIVGIPGTKTYLKNIQDQLKVIPNLRDLTLESIFNHISNCCVEPSRLFLPEAMHLVISFNDYFTKKQSRQRINSTT